MKIKICGNTRFQKEKVKWLVDQLRVYAPKITEDRDLIVSVAGAQRGRVGEEWAEKEAFDLVKGDRIRLTLIGDFLRSKRPKSDLLFWGIHELMHARQQLEGRLYRGPEDWKVLYFRPRGERSARRYDLTRARYMKKGSYVALGYRDRYGNGAEGARLPWEKEALWEHYMQFPANFNAYYDRRR